MPEPRTADDFLRGPAQGPLAPQPAPQPTPAPAPQPGFFQAAMQPFGLAPAAGRETTRQVVRGLPGPLRMGVEAAPSAVGTIAGATLGPLGAVAGAGGGEALGQMMGLAPESRTNLALSPLSAGAGYGAGRLGPLAAKLLVTKFPGVRQAVRQMDMEKFFPAAQRYLSKYAPPVAVSRLYQQATAQGFRVPGAAFAQTRDALRSSIKKLRRRFFTKTFQEGRELREVLDQFQTYLDKPNVQLDVLVEARQMLGRMFQDFSRKRGVRLGMAGQVEKALIQDMEKLGQSSEAIGGPATAAVLRAIEAAKRQFALFKMEHAWARGFRAPDDISVRPILRKLADWTVPGSKYYDKNFVATMGPHLPEITAFLQRIERTLGSGKRQAGALMFAQRAAKGGERLATGTLGFFTAGALGGGIPTQMIGALIGLNAPEILMSLSLSPGGRALIEHVLRWGSGQLTPRIMAILANAATRQASSGIEQGLETLTMPNLRGLMGESGGQRPPRRPAEEFLR